MQKLTNPKNDEKPILSSHHENIAMALSVRKFSSVRFFALKTGNRGLQPV
jgi:hypothetical protein